MITLRRLLVWGGLANREWSENRCQLPEWQEDERPGFQHGSQTKSSGSNLPTTLRHTTLMEAARSPWKEVQFTAAITSLTVRVMASRPLQFTILILPKTNNIHRYDDLSQVWYTSTTCPADQGGWLLRSGTTARDLDVFVGTGTTPQSALETAKAVIPGYLSILMSAPRSADRAGSWCKT